MDPGRIWDASGRPLDGRSCPGSVRPLAGLDALGPRHQLSMCHGLSGNYTACAVISLVAGPDLATTYASLAMPAVSTLHRSITAVMESIQ